MRKTDLIFLFILILFALVGMYVVKEYNTNFKIIRKVLNQHNHQIQLLNGEKNEIEKTEKPSEKVKDV